MARKPSVWFRKQDKFYYTTIRGEQIKLSQDRAEAEREYHRRLAELPEEGAPLTKDPKTAAVVKAFLLDSHAKNDPETYRRHKRFLLSFARNYGKLPVSRLIPDMAYRWVGLHESWGDASRRAGLSDVQACLNWAVKRGIIQGHRLAKLEKPPAKARDAFVSPAEQRRILDHLRTSDPFRDFVFALTQTGCRPSELARVQCEDFDPEAGVWVMQKHKTRKKTGKPRTVYLSPEMLELSKRLAKDAGGKGTLFRNRDNRTWKRSSISYRLRKLAAELQIPGLSSYLFRHGFITSALEKGMSDAVVAELCGNSPVTIRRHYTHLKDKLDFMREQAKKAVAG